VPEPDRVAEVVRSGADASPRSCTSSAAVTSTVGRNEVAIDEEALRTIDPENPAAPLDLLYIEDDYWETYWDLTETVKGYVAIEPESDASLRVDRAIVGNYRLAFGQGLVMDNTDFFLPRKTGHGWNKRPGTVIGDDARTMVASGLNAWIFFMILSTFSCLAVSILLMMSTSALRKLVSPG